MKKMLLAIFAATMMLYPSFAAAENAEPVRHHRPHRKPHRPKRPHRHHPPLYKCQASSDYAWGIGYGPTRRRAAEMALYRCARGTPRGSICVLDWCRRIR